MNLTSCDECGVVFDRDKIEFPVREYGDDGEVADNFTWDGDKFIAFVKCPVCNEGEIRSE